MKKIKFLFLFLILFLLKISNSYSLIQIDITRGNLDPLPIAVSPFFSEKDVKNELNNQLNIEDLGLEISKVVANNLKRTGLFNTLSKEAFLQKPDIAHLKPRFEDWTLIKSQVLITGKISTVTTDKEKLLKVEFKLWDVLAAKWLMASH